MRDYYRITAGLIFRSTELKGMPEVMITEKLWGFDSSGRYLTLVRTVEHDQTPIMQFGAVAEVVETETVSQKQTKQSENFHL